MRKFIKISIPVLLFLGIGFLVFKSIKKIEHKKQIEQQIQEIPQFNFENIQTGLQFTNLNLEKNKPTIYIYFNTECGHCKYEILEINDNIEWFDNINLILVSIEEPEILLEFFKDKKMFGKSNVSILYDKQLNFEKVFGECPFPTVFIYNKKQELIKVVKGEVKMEFLLKYLES